MISKRIATYLGVFYLLYLVSGRENGSDLPNLMDATLDDLTSGLKAYRFTSVDLVKAYNARIIEANHYTRAVTELNPDALSIAAALDVDRAKGHVKGLLHGVPVLVKDNIATMDKMNTTAGSYALLGAKVPQDSTVVAKLRAAGAVILGKANMSQWASWRGNGTNGWSAYGGQCKGVYYPNQDPSGSSSGSAVGTTLGLTFAALGSETAGSLMMPAQSSNLVAIKPTVGLTSRSLLIPVSTHQDTVGPISRSVKDAAIVLQIIAGRDLQDNYTFAQPYPLPDYASACNLSALSGARIGIPRNLIEANEGYDPTHFNAAAKIMQAAGATVVDNLNITDFALGALSSNTSRLVTNVDFASALPSYLLQLTSNPHNIRNISDLRQFTRSFSLEDYSRYPHVDTSKWDEIIDLDYDNTSPQFWTNYQTNLKIGGSEGILGILKNHSLDALIAPTDSAFNLPGRIGTPVVNVPLGFNGDESKLPIMGGASTTLIGGAAENRNPIGISFMGAKWSEEKLIGYAYAFEQKTRVREKGPQPYLMPRTQLVDVIGSQNTSMSNATAKY